MSAATFEKVMPLILAHEGGYVDLKADPGGATRFGITFATLKAWRSHPITKLDVKTLTVPEAMDIYRARYWNVIRGDDLPAGVDYAVLDYAINSGTDRASKALQQVSGARRDGKIGPATIAAAKEMDADLLAAAICDIRLAFLKRLKTWPHFWKGWTRRVEEVRKVALELARA